jgi:hypothetical protein
MCESHPSDAFVRTPTGHRTGRKGVLHTLQSKFGHVVEPYLNEDGVLSPVLYKRTLNTIHTQVVDKNKKSLVSKLLGSVPPEISELEKTLPR